MIAIETQYVLPSYRKSWSTNPLVILDLTSVLSLKVISDFQGQSYIKHAISGLLLRNRNIETQYVLPSYSKSWSGNPLMILDLTSDLSFKVNSDFRGQSYIKHAISALSLPIETQYILPLYRKSWSRNPLLILDLTCDLSFKVIGDFQGQSYTKHVISVLLLPVETQYVLPSYRKHGQGIHW